MYGDWLQVLNMHSLSKTWLKGDMVTIYKYLKSLNVKERKAFSGYRREAAGQNYQKKKESEFKKSP